MKFSKIGSHQDVAGFRYPATAILCCLLVCIHTIYGVKVISIPEKKWTLTKKMMASPKKVFNITCHYYQHLYPSPLTNCGFSQHPKSLDRPRTAGPLQRSTTAALLSLLPSSKTETWRKGWLWSWPILRLPSGKHTKNYGKIHHF